MTHTTNTKKITLTAILLSIMILFSLTPIGFIQIGVIRATLIHIPVILGSILLGPKKGAFLGFCFGLMSLITNTINPTPLSFVFSPFIPVLGQNNDSIWSLFICFVPRILIGIIPFYLWSLFKRHFQKNHLQRPLIFSVAFLTSFIHTILVMNFIYLFFNKPYASLKDVTAQTTLYKIIISTIFINGVPEALVAGFLIAAIAPPLLNILNK